MSVRETDPAHAETAGAPPEGPPESPGTPTDARAPRTRRSRLGGLPTREALLRSALELFTKLGFDGVAVPDIARQAGVAAGTIYRHFKSKEALVNALYRRWRTRMLEQLLEGFPGDLSPRQQFGAFWRRLTDFAKAHPLAFAFLELHHHAEYLDAESRALEPQVLAPIVAFFERCRELGVTKPMQPQVLIAIVWGAFVGMVKAERLGLLNLNDDTIAEAEESTWDAVRRTGAPSD